MIFLSHTHADKPLVDNIARSLAAVFGQDAIFYDSWSIQPGDGIIDRMNAGLENCRVFFFFVSKKSLQSKMVQLEWQNALIKSTRGESKIVPVRIDDVLMPPVLLQTLYIDIFSEGLETGVRQMVDVIQGRNTYRSIRHDGFQNVRAYVSGTAAKLTVEFRAEAYMEPHSRYLILLGNAQEDLSWSAPGEGMFESGYNTDVQLENGERTNALLMARAAATSPGFPFVVELTAKEGKILQFGGAMRIVSRERFQSIPVIQT